MRLRLLCAVVATALLCAQPTHADTLVYFNNFNNGTTPTLGAGVTGGIGGAGFAVSSGGYNGKNGSAFSGNLWQNNTTTPSATTLTLSNLPQHTQINLSFLLAVIDSWDGLTAAGTNAPDYFNVLLDGTPILQASYDNTLTNGISDSPKGTQLIAPLGLGFSSGLDSGYDLGAASELQNIPHTASSLTFSFIASGAGYHGGNDESFALDNLRVGLIYDPPVVQDPTPTAVPLPGSIPGGTALLAAMIIQRIARRRSAA